MSDLIISVSGLRGVIGGGLTPEIASRYAAAFGVGLDAGKVLVARDSRPTGEMLAYAIKAGLSATGCTVVDLGIAATPTCGLLVDQLGAAGGIEISASHNPPEWNGIKLFHRDGRVLNASEGAAIKDRFEGEIPLRPWNQIGQMEQHPDPHSAHLNRVLDCVNVELIRQRRFRVVLDSNHGAGGILGERLLKELGCELVQLGAEPHGGFAHTPEPLPENLDGLCRAVVDRSASLGFAQDPDADRLAIVDNYGNPIGEEYTITLIAMHLLRKIPGPIVVNLSTTKAVEKVAESHGTECLRSAVGEANVVALMQKHGARIGGEGNGGVILPDIVSIRDSFAGMAIVLEALAESGGSFDRLVAQLPRFEMIKTKFSIETAKLKVGIEKLKERFDDAKADDVDGLRLDWDDRWVHIRPSNTEPVARVIAEAESLDDAQRLVQQVRAVLGV